VALNADGTLKSGIDFHLTFHNEGVPAAMTSRIRTPSSHDPVQFVLHVDSAPTRFLRQALMIAEGDFLVVG
jgi:hypothetical protein